MRIALLQPSYWPEVRRGTERVVHDLGARLAGRGHDVTLITSHPGPGTLAIEDGVRVVRTRRPPRPAPLHWYEDHIESAPAMVRRLLRDNYDLAHAFVPSYAWAAVKARRLGGPPTVFSFHGIPERRYLIARRYRIEMLETIVAKAAATTVLSQAAAAVFRRYLLADPVVLPGGVVSADFAGQEARASRPTLICSASLGDPRKGAALLFSAFESLRQSRGDARLVLVRTPDPIMSPTEVRAPAGAEWIDANDTAALARAYSQAWASVLTATGEAFGLVLIESMAAGTPVVAPRSGGCPEIVSGERVGRLYAPGDEADLVRAMEQALELGREDATAEACRKRAAAYDWERVIEGYEQLYASVVRSDVEAA
jgi:glycosyltransferase involved in cell wall biosynthesis